MMQNVFSLEEFKVLRENYEEHQIKVNKSKAKDFV